MISAFPSNFNNLRTFLRGKKCTKTASYFHAVVKSLTYQLDIITKKTVWHTNNAVPVSRIVVFSFRRVRLVCLTGTGHVAPGAVSDVQIEAVVFALHALEVMAIFLPSFCPHSSVAVVHTSVSLGVYDIALGF